MSDEEHPNTVDEDISNVVQGHIAARLSYIFKTLKANGISELEVSFDGHSDEGKIRFSNAVGDLSKVKEITLYDEVSPNTFLDEPTPFMVLVRNSSKNYERKPTLADIIWQCVYAIFEYKDFNWCVGRGNKGYLKFNCLNNKVEVKYLKYVETYATLSI